MCAEGDGKGKVSDSSDSKCSAGFFVWVFRAFARWERKLRRFCWVGSKGGVLHVFERHLKMGKGRRLLVAWLQELFNSVLSFASHRPHIHCYSVSFLSPSYSLTPSFILFHALPLF